MGRTKGSTLAVVGNVRRVIKPHETWVAIDGFLIIESAVPFERRGSHFITPSEILKKYHASPRSRSLSRFSTTTHYRSPSPPIPKVILRLKPPRSAPSPPPSRPQSPPPLPPPSPPTKTFDREEFEAAIETERARHARYEAICDRAGVPSIRPMVPPAKPRPRRRRRDHLHKPCRPRPPPLVVEAREPEPNLLAMGEVNLICWETMPPPTP